MKKTFLILFLLLSAVLFSYTFEEELFLNDFYKNYKKFEKYRGNKKIQENLGRYLFHLVSTGVPPRLVAKKYAERYEFLTASKTLSYKGEYPLLSGSGKGKIKLMFYISSTCNECFVELKGLLAKMKEENLESTIDIYAIPFKMRIGEISSLVAFEMGKYREFLMKLSEVDIRIDKEVCLDTAESIGIDRAEFESRLKSPKTLKKLKFYVKDASKKMIGESSTIVINGKLYKSSPEPEWIVDAVKYELNLSGK